MASNLGSLFDYTPPTDGRFNFFEIIKDCENSAKCHIKLLELFMNALKLSSIHYRTGTFPSQPSIPAIPNITSLEQLLNYIPEDIIGPLSRVMYEQWHFQENTHSIGNNAWYIKTYSDTTKPHLQSAVDVVLSVEYALTYNDLIAEYKQKSWHNGIPDPIPTPTGAPKKDDVITHIEKLKDWINDKDPKIKALTKLEDETTAVKIIDTVFAATPPQDIDVVDFCVELIDQIESKSNVKVNNSGQLSKNLFKRTVLGEIREDSGIWKEKLPMRTQATIYLLGRRDNIELFESITELFMEALSIRDIKKEVVSSLKNIFQKFNTDTTLVPNYLLDRLKATCKSLKKTINPDPEMLTGWVSEIKAPLSTSIHYSKIEALMEVVGEVLPVIPLTFNHEKIQLFAYSSYDNLKSIAAVGSINPEGTNGINVFADAKENGHIYSRPLFGVFTDRNSPHNTYLKFFNVTNPSHEAIPNGTFYFTDPNDPTEVKVDYFHNPPPSGSLRFDFEKVTINGSEKVTKEILGKITSSNISVGTPYKGVTRYNLISERTFYSVIKNITKWKKLNTLRKFDVLYQTIFNLGSPTSISTHLIWYTASGDLNRTDHVEDELCLWEWLASDEVKRQYSQLPELLGLPQGRSKNLFPTGTGVNNESSYGGFKYDIYNLLSSGIQYVLTNTPHPKLPIEIVDVLGGTAKPAASLGEEATKILSIFNFHYYRVIDSSIDKVVKWLPDKNSPDFFQSLIIQTPKPPLPSSKKYRQAGGINLPISFRLSYNIKAFKDYTTPDSTAGAYLKNKGNPLYRPKGKRVDAGAVMAKLRRDIKILDKPGTNQSLSATEFGNWELGISEKVRQAWQKLKNTNQSRLPTDQEWCHLLGHGDGGGERLGNFVSGSFHCNTEQLAMESKGRRQVTQSAPKGTFELRSTAYLFNDNEEVLKDNYLRNDHAYQKMISVRSKLHAATGKKPMRLDGAGKVLPFAAFIRYKIYNANPQEPDDSGGGSKMHSGESQPIKLFDHIFEGQSEFIDQHQFSILKHAAWFAVAGMEAFNRWYAEQTGAVAAGSAAAAAGPTDVDPQTNE